MQKIKKRIISILLVVMLFLLVACGAEEIDNRTVTVNFNTNGGSFIASVVLDTNTISSFALPDNPTKEGYDFIGWYMDENLEKVFDEVKIDDGSIILYAKWKEKKSKKELATEMLGGSWTNTVLTATFEKDSNQCTLKLLNEEYKGTYSIDDYGEISITTIITILPVTTKANIKNNKLVLTFLNQNFELKKVPEYNYELISLPELSELEGADFETTKSFGLKLNINMKDSDATKKAKDLDPNASDVYKDTLIEFTLDLKINGKVEKINVEDINDLNAFFELKGNFKAMLDGEEITDDSYVAFKKSFDDIKVYITKGTVYVDIVIAEEHVEGEGVDAKKTYTYPVKHYAVDLKTLLEKLASNYNLPDFEALKEQYLPEEAKDKSVNELVKEINTIFNSILTSAYTYGVSEDEINKVLNILDLFKPVKNESGDEITYSLTKERLLSSLGDLKSFVKDNKEVFRTIYNLVNTEEVLTEQEYNDIVNGLEETYDTLENELDIKEFFIQIKKENGHVKTIDQNEEFTIYLNDNHKSYIVISNYSDTLVKSIHPNITFPEFDGYEDVTENFKTEEK